MDKCIYLLYKTWSLSVSSAILRHWKNALDEENTDTTTIVTLHGLIEYMYVPIKGRSALAALWLALVDSRALVK